MRSVPRIGSILANHRAHIHCPERFRKWWIVPEVRGRLRRLTVPPRSPAWTTDAGPVIARQRRATTAVLLLTTRAQVLSHASQASWSDHCLRTSMHGLHAMYAVRAGPTGAEGRHCCGRGVDHQAAREKRGRCEAAMTSGTWALALVSMALYAFMLRDIARSERPLTCPR